MAEYNVKGAERRVEENAIKAGQNLAKMEDLAIKAFTLKPNEEKAIADLAKELGAPADTDLDGLRLFAKRLMDKAASAYEMLSAILGLKKRTMDAVINNIGR